MNRNLFIIACLGLVTLVTLSCNKEKTEVAPTSAMAAQQTTSPTLHSAHRDSNDHSLFIDTEVANKMIGSYIYSLANSSTNTFGPDVHSYSLDADSLRAYLADPHVRNIK